MVEGRAGEGKGMDIVKNTGGKYKDETN